MSSKVDQHITKNLPSNAKASNVLVGEVYSLPHTVIAFVRLACSALLGDLTKVPIPTKFIFVQLGPVGDQVCYHEVGCSIASLCKELYNLLRLSWKYIFVARCSMMRHTRKNVMKIFWLALTNFWIR